jgi:hypothetical protein
MLSAIKKAKQISFVFIDQQHPPGSSWSVFIIIVSIAIIFVIIL